MNRARLTKSRRRRRNAWQRLTSGTIPPDPHALMAGTWFGDAGDYLGMQVNIAVHEVGDLHDSSEG